MNLNENMNIQDDDVNLLDQFSFFLGKNYLSKYMLTVT